MVVLESCGGLGGAVGWAEALKVVVVMVAVEVRRRWWWDVHVRVTVTVMGKEGREDQQGTQGRGGRTSGNPIVCGSGWKGAGR